MDFNLKTHSSSEVRAMRSLMDARKPRTAEQKRKAASVMYMSHFNSCKKCVPDDPCDIAVELFVTHWNAVNELSKERKS